MPKQGQTTAQARRAARQEDNREQIAQQGHINKVIDNIVEIEGLDFFKKGDDQQIDYKMCQANKFRMDALKTANEQRLKLVNKYLPDLKSTELTAEGGGAIQITEVTRTIVR